MSDFIIKVRLIEHLEPDLFKVFQRVPRGRRAETMRRLAIDGLRVRTMQASPAPSTLAPIQQVSEPGNSDHDNDIFGSDLGACSALVSRTRE